MSVLALPTLNGQGWTVHKKPRFSTLIASHASGREVRGALFQNPLWDFELTFDGLAGDAATYPGLGANSLQSLMGLYLQCQGQLGTFLYTDPTDNSANGQALGTGDGVRTAFTLTRTLGGFVEPCSWVTNFTPFIDGVAQSSGFTFASPNLLTFAAPPLGAPGPAYLLAEDGTNAVHTTFQSLTSQLSGTNITFAAYVQAATRSKVFLEVYNGSTYPNVLFDLAAATASPSAGVTAQSTTSVGAGWFKVSMTAPMVATATPSLYILDATGPSQAYQGIVNNGVAFCGAQAAIGAGAPAYLPPFTLASGASVSASAAATPAGALVAASINFGFLCRFSDDSLDFENFMQNLWAAKSVKFQSVRTS